METKEDVKSKVVSAKPTPASSNRNFIITPQRKALFIWSKCWRPFFTILFPLLLSPIFLWKGIPINDKPGHKQARGAFVVLLMACYWVSECLPLPATALLPVAIFPLLDVLDTDTVSSVYFGAGFMLLFAGCVVAQAFEYSNLHVRIALKVTTIVGARVPFLLAGSMTTAMLLSMWLNNTSTAAMMVPIIDVIMNEFEAAETEMNLGSSAPTTKTADGVTPIVDEQPKPEEVPSIKPSKISVPAKSPDQVASKKKARNIKIMFLLGIAWAANIGGTGIITGTATNIIAQEAVEQSRLLIEDELGNIGEGEKKEKLQKCLSEKNVFEVTFVGWMAFNVVPMLLSTVATWAILLAWFTGPSISGIKRIFNRKKRSPADTSKAQAAKNVTKNIETAIHAKYNQLGPITLHEIFVLILFGILVFLWVTGNMDKGLGWFYLLVDDKKKPYPHPSVPAIFVCVVMFVLPKEKKYYKEFMNGGLTEGLNDPVLPWSEVETKLPWGPLVLIGGGFAISRGISGSGLNLAIGRFLETNPFLNNLEPWQYLIFILLFVAILTTIASNTATASILAPVLITLATTSKKNIHPMYLLITSTASASYAFMLPISTPPNAIVFEKSDMKQSEMALPGLIVTIVTNVILFAMVHSYEELIFGFNEYKKHGYCVK